MSATSPAVQTNQPGTRLRMGARPVGGAQSVATAPSSNQTAPSTGAGGGAVARSVTPEL
jgi:hypothetical protein